jgi:KDO2-lipid IV(A) lauroyltransferase
VTAPDEVSSRESPVLSRIALRSALTLAAALPPRVSRTVARALAMIQYGCSGARRRAVLENLAWIGAAGHPRLKRREDRDRVARAIFESYQRFLLEFLSQGRAFRPEAVVPVGFSGMDTLYRAVGRGRGAIVVAPHVGNWEWGALALARLGFRVHAVTGVQLHAALAPAVRSLKERQGIAVHTPSDGFAPLVTALRRGGLVLLLADGDVRSRSVAVPFFGRMVGMPVGPALLARRTQAPIVHAHARRQSLGAVEVVIDGLDRADRSLPLDADIRRLTERIAAAAEATIARHVTQWCIFRPIFGSTEAAVAPGAPPRRNAA